MLGFVVFFSMAITALIYLPISVAIAMAIVWLIGMGFTGRVIQMSCEDGYDWSDNNVRHLAIVLWPLTWIIALGASLV